MIPNSPLKIVTALPVTDGAGVHIRRGIGTDVLRNLDPFLMIDHFGSDNPDDYIAGFPNHPHRGFITLTYMLDGHMLHKDSMDNHGHLKSGGVQWMKAASGIIHSEMPQQEAGLMRGFQLWINLPAADKMSDPAYQEFAADQVPNVESAGTTVKVVAGSYEGTLGPVIDRQTELSFFDVHLSRGAAMQGLDELAECCFVYVYEGSLAIQCQDTVGHTDHHTPSDDTQDDYIVSAHTLGVFDAGRHKTVSSLKAATDETRFVVIAGRPIGEPIVQHGPFVMNTVAEIESAISDYQRGQLVRTKAKRTLTRSAIS